MTEPWYFFVSAFSSFYLLHYSCLSILQPGIRASSILAVALWWLLGLISLASIFNNSRLGCWFIAFNNLVSALEALGFLSIISLYIFQAGLI